MKKRYNAIPLAAFAVLTHTTLRADVTWDITPGTVGAGDSAITGGAGTWNLANGNWTTDGGANNVAWNNANIDTAIFGGTAGIVTINGADVTVGGLTVNTNNYDIRSNAAEKIVFGAAGNLNVTGTTVFIRSVISETGGARKITKIGGGTVELFGANDFSGGLEIDAGTVRAMGGGTSFGAAGTTITIDGGQIHGRNTQVHQQGILLNQTKTSFVKGNGGTWEFTGAVTGTGGLQVNDAGSVFQRTLTFSSTANTFQGVIDMTPNRAAFQVNSLADSVTANGNIQFDGSEAYFGMGPGTAVPITLNNRRIEMTAVGSTNRIGNANTDSNLNILTINTDLLVSAATGVGTKTLQLEGANQGNNAFNGVIANGVFDTLNLNKTGAGKWILGGANTYNGTTTISGGTLALGANNVLPDASSVSIGAGTLDASTFTDTAGTLDPTGAATIHLGSGAALAFADSSAVDWTGGTLNITGTLGATSLRFGTTSGGLTTDQKNAISFNSSGAGTYTLDANGYLVSGSGSPTYASWSGGAAADEDANGDGVSNAVAWALDAADVNENAIGLLPTLDNSDPTFFIFNFNRSNDAEADASTSITVQYASDLSGWTTAADNGTTVLISTTPGTPTTAVQVKIDRSLATGNKLFARLKVAVTP